jgi:monoamine oxidase
MTGKTPLFRALTGLARDHLAAGRAGVPVDEFRDIRSALHRGELSRRTIVKLGAVAPLGLAVPTAVAATKPPVKPARVAVIGAGMSGLTAALTLADNGIGCTVYEASGRVGGRMYSNDSYWADGQTSEWGGEAIDQEHTMMRQLAQRFGLDTVDVTKAAPSSADQVFWFDNGYYARSQADEDFKAVNHWVQRDLRDACPEATWQQSTAHARFLDNMPLYEWIESRVPGGHTSRLGQLLDVAYNIEYGADTTRQSSLALIYLLGWQRNPGNFNIWGLSDERYHIVGGNQQLAEAIAGHLPDGTVQYGWKLLAVKRNTDGTQTLTFDNNGTTKTVTADHTILAVPLGVLQRIDLTRAGLDPLKRDSLAAMKMGSCTKLNMQFLRRTWLGTGPWPGVASGETFTDLPFQQAWDTTAGQPGQRGILIQYNGGSTAEAVRPATPFATDADPVVRRFANDSLAQIDIVYPGTRSAWTGKATFSAWHLNPLAYGAYVFWPTGYVSRYAGYEPVRQGDLHFAGEHCSYDFQGWMNGAAIEGDRAAREVLEDLR